MRICVSSTGKHLDVPVDERFGRCTRFLAVDTETMEFEVIENDGPGLSSGAGVNAGQKVAANKCDAVASGHFGPKATSTMSAAGIPGYVFGSGTVREAVEAFNAGRLEEGC